MRLGLYSSLPRGNTPNLVSLQDEALTGVPTVLVCPLKAGFEITVFRTEVRWGAQALVACTELARPVRRTGLRPMGWLDEVTSRRVMECFRALLAH